MTSRHGSAAPVVVAMTGVTIVAMDWVPTPLNRNIAHVEAARRIPGSLVHGVTCAAASLVLARGPLWARRLVPAWFGVVLGSAAVNWWVPYVVGRYPGEVDPDVFEREYAANLSVLPARPGHPVVPDVQHLVIHGLVAASVALSARAAFARGTVIGSRFEAEATPAPRHPAPGWNADATQPVSTGLQQPCATVWA